MKKISTIITYDKPVSGVYWISNEISKTESQDIVNSIAPKIYYIQGSHIRTREEFLGLLRTIMNSPEACAYNWDMLLDCMRSVNINSVPNDTQIFIYNHIEVFAESDLSEFQTAITVMKYATASWREHYPEKRMYVLLSGKKSVLSDISNITQWSGKQIMNDFWLLSDIK